MEYPGYTVTDQGGDDKSIYDIELKDEDLLKVLSTSIPESQSYWEEEFGNREARENNMKIWLPGHTDAEDYYDHQEGYIYENPRAFVDEQTATAMVNARMPEPDIMPAQDNIISICLAKDIQKTITSHNQKYETKEIFKMAYRNLGLKRIGVAKLRFDENIGKYGDIVPEHILPEDIVVSKDAKWNESPRLIAQKIRGVTGEDLLAMFPDKEQVIYEMLGCKGKKKNGDLYAHKTQLAKTNDLWETWFKYFDEDLGLYSYGLAWVDSQFGYVIEKMRNPNWNYEDPVTNKMQGGSEQETDKMVSNILDAPEAPFFFMNMINDGSSFYDLTTLMEQARPMQRILDRRGFQIMDNSEQAGSGIIFNTEMINKKDIGKLVGAPDEKIGVKGNVSQAVMRIPPPMLPNYVMADKEEAKREIDNIFGTHDVTRGETSDNATLGQDRIQLGQDSTRLDEAGRAIERFATKYYRYLVQMMKVYYTEDHFFKAVGENGQFDFVVMRADLIEDGIDINVTAGSSLPINKAVQAKWVTDLANLGFIDPLTIFEVAHGGNLPKPTTMLERLVLWQNAPDQLLQKVRDDEFDRNALIDIQILNRAEMPKMRDEYTDGYFTFFNKYMTSGDFIKQPDQVKTMYVDHLRTAQEQAFEQLRAMEQQLPTPDEVQAANQKAAQDAQTESQIAQAPSNQPPQPIQNNRVATKTNTKAPQSQTASSLKQQDANAKLSGEEAPPIA